MGELLNSGFQARLIHQFLEYGQDFSAEVIDALDVISEVAVITGVLEPLLKHLPGDLDIAAEALDGLPAQEEPVEHRGFPLDVYRVELFRLLPGDGQLGRLHLFYARGPRGGPDCRADNAV